MKATPLRFLFCGPIWPGSTARHRQEALAAQEGVQVRVLDSGGRVGRSSLLDRIRYRLRWPADHSGINSRLVAEAKSFLPDVVMIDSVPVVTPSTLRALRGAVNSVLSYYSPDDLSAPHIRTRQLAACETLWDAVFTTKTFNVPELRARGVRRALLAGKSYHPPVHHPRDAQEVGAEFERFDVVLAATYEQEREELLQACANRGLSVVVLGGGWDKVRLPSGCERRPNAWDNDYARALHFGKVALCPLRRISRDLITARSIELPACGRAMIGEKTDEHDSHFMDGSEYVAYRTAAEAAEIAMQLVCDEPHRKQIAAAGRARCLNSGYSTFDRANWMVRELRKIVPA
jgi:spore maturation protein CgeB